MPPKNFTDADSFLPTSVADARDGFATGTVAITVTDQPLRVESITRTRGTVTIIYVGLPNYPYQVRSQDTMIGPWIDAGSPITSDATGHFPFVDSTTLPPKRFYRAIAP